MRIITIGDGAMATVCSQILAEKHGAALPVTMWGRNAEHLAKMQRERVNARYLPAVGLSEHLGFEADEARVFAGLTGADLILCALPTQYIRAALMRLAPHIPAGVPVVSVAKGIEISTLLRPSQIITELLGRRPVAAFSGPSIASELARKLPATMVAAADDAVLAQRVQELFTCAYLRVYTNSDLIGVELAGALKNVVAIAAGILQGMNAGHNAKAALISRGLVEITRLGLAMGAQAETFYGLAGLGDLVTTCFSPEGRNRTFGERLGRGEKPEAILATMAGVVEGMPTTKAVYKLAKDHGIDMPICRGLFAVLYEGAEPKSEIAQLMSRESKCETE